MTSLDFKAINRELHQIRRSRLSSRYATRRVLPSGSIHPHWVEVAQAYVKPSDQKKARPSERRVHLFVVSNVIGITTGLGLIWLAIR